MALRADNHQARAESGTHQYLADRRAGFAQPEPAATAGVSVMGSQQDAESCEIAEVKIREVRDDPPGPAGREIVEVLGEQRSAGDVEISGWNDDGAGFMVVSGDVQALEWSHGLCEPGSPERLAWDRVCGADVFHSDLAGQRTSARPLPVPHGDLVRKKSDGRREHHLFARSVT
ncbi:MAG TPA: hypothetical protein VGX23_05080 [Actinocrinis sp.]|nr:hypothetical protein [Actinocrinis sp.]